MVDACQTVNCGHHFCKHCLDHLYNERKYVNFNTVISDKLICMHTYYYVCFRVFKCPRSECGARLWGDDGTKVLIILCIII